MVDPQKILATLDSLNDMSKDVDFGTFANLALYTLIVASQAIEHMPPALQMQVKHCITSIVDEATGSISETDNRAAWQMLERLGLSAAPTKETYLWHVALVRN